MFSISPDQDLRFMRSVLSESDDCIKIIGLDGSLQFMSDGGKRVMEVDNFDEIKGCPWPDFWQDQGNASAVAAIECARAGKASSFTAAAKTAKGKPRYWHVKVSPILGVDGQVVSILSVSRDVTATKEFEEQQELLRHELSHRIKNILALVQAVANQTLRQGDDMASAKSAFMARLAALGQAQDLLIQKTHERTSLSAVAETAASQLPGRIIVSGPHVALSSRSAIAIAMSLHELLTNAIKYGALSNDRGYVELSWRLDNAGDEAALEMVWTEKLGPPVKQPKGKGFGAKMIERVLTSYVNGAASISYLHDGVVVRLNAPLKVLSRD